MADSLTLPMFERILPDGLDYGTIVLIEFQPDSIWFEASLTIAAQALRKGQKTEYHTFQHAPIDVRRGLTTLGTNLGTLENSGLFTLIDSYTLQMGGLVPIEQGRDTRTHSLKVADVSIAEAKDFHARPELPAEEKRWLHVDDNTAILTRHNTEPAVFDFFRNRVCYMNRNHEHIVLFSILRGTVSDTFLSQFESISDGIIDFKAEENAGEVEQLVRVRIMRRKKFMSRWQRLNLTDTGEVTLIE
ncbi:MAG: ATPase domain-containing protein [Candidatus Bathyarchaeia archaeon]